MIYEQDGFRIDSTVFKDKLITLPIEIVWRMLYYATEQGNTLSTAVKALTTNPIYNCSKGGFDWNKTIEGYQFWQQVIQNKNFAEYFVHYPRCLGKYSDFQEDKFTFRTPLMDDSLISLILERARKTSYYHIMNKSIVALFDWYDTPEGFEFWKDINAGKIKNIKTKDNETKLQKARSSVSRGTEIQGHRICGKEGISSITSRPLSYRGILGKWKGQTWRN